MRCPVWLEQITCYKSEQTKQQELDKLEEVLI